MYLRVCLAFYICFTTKKKKRKEESWHVWGHRAVRMAVRTAGFQRASPAWLKSEGFILKVRSLEGFRMIWFVFYKDQAAIITKKNCEREYACPGAMHSGQGRALSLCPGWRAAQRAVPQQVYANLIFLVPWMSQAWYAVGGKWGLSLIPNVSAVFFLILYGSQMHKLTCIIVSIPARVYWNDQNVSMFGFLGSWEKSTQTLCSFPGMVHPIGFISLFMYFFYEYL